MMTATGKKWLASKRKRDRDIRDFIPVHGKVIKTSPPYTLQPPSRENSTGAVERGSSKTRQISLSQLQERRRQPNYPNRIPASVFSKGVRRKAPLKEKQVSQTTADSTKSSTSATKLVEKGGVCENDRGKENRCDTAPSRTKMTVSTTVRCPNPPTIKSSLNNSTFTSTRTTHIPHISMATRSKVLQDENKTSSSPSLKVPSTTTHRISLQRHAQPHISMVTNSKAPQPHITMVTNSKAPQPHITTVTNSKPPHDDSKHITTSLSSSTTSPCSQVPSITTHRTTTPDHLQPHISVVTSPITVHKTSSLDHCHSHCTTQCCTTSPCHPVPCWLNSRSCEHGTRQCIHQQPQRHTECKENQTQNFKVLSTDEPNANSHHKHSLSSPSTENSSIDLGDSLSLTVSPTSPALSWDTDALLAELSSCERMCDKLLNSN